MEVTCQGKECTQISSMLPLGQAQKWHLHQTYPQIFSCIDSVRHLCLSRLLCQLLVIRMGLTHALKLPCVSNTIFCNSKSRRKFWGPGHTLLSKAKCFLMPVEVLSQRGACAPDAPGSCHNIHVLNQKLA